MTHPAPLLILSHDVVGSRMAGPGIRYVQMARALAQTLPVTLAVPGDPPADFTLPGVRLVGYTPDDWATLAPLVAEARACLLSGDLATFPQWADATIPLIVDGYDPVLAEWLAVHAGMALDELPGLWHSRRAAHAAQFRIGDFFICASERQRDWWLGQLEAHGRINPATHRTDPTLRSLLDVVPYGLPDAPPAATRRFLKGIWSGIGPADKVVLWGGGLWTWLDAPTAVHAMTHLAAARPEIKLLFPGTRHPNAAMAAMPGLVTDLRGLATDLGLLDRTVFLGDWVEYADWPNVLLESDVALTLHRASLEARLAFRSRVLDYVWAGLPTVATHGDATADLVTAYGVGEQVPPGDAAAVAAAIVRQIDAPPPPAAFARARTDLTWTRAVAPLAAFCRAPRRAADRGGTFLPTPPAAASIPDPADVAQLRAEAAHWRALAEGYAQGRVMRLLTAAQRALRPRHKHGGPTP